MSILILGSDESEKHCQFDIKICWLFYRTRLKVTKSHAYTYLTFKTFDCISETFWASVNCQWLALGGKAHSLPMHGYPPPGPGDPRDPESPRPQDLKTSRPWDSRTPARGPRTLTQFFYSYILAGSNELTKLNANTTLQKMCLIKIYKIIKKTKHYTYTHT